MFERIKTATDIIDGCLPFAVLFQLGDFPGDAWSKAVVSVLILLFVAL